MDIQVLLQRIEHVNAESQRLANERNINLGKRNALEKQLTEALGEYNRKYGTSVTVDTIEEELQKVYNEKEKEVALIEEALHLVDSGDFAGAERVLGVAPSTGMTGAVASGNSPAGVVASGNNNSAGAVVPGNNPAGVAAPGNSVVPPVSFSENTMLRSVDSQMSKGAAVVEVPESVAGRGSSFPVKNPNYTIPDLSASADVPLTNPVIDEVVAPPPSINSFNSFVKGAAFDLDGSDM